MVLRSYNIEAILYQDFKTICTAEGSTATDVIQKLIAGYVSENKGTIYAKSTETKLRMYIPKMYDENRKWRNFFKNASDQTLLDVWYRIIFLHSLAQKSIQKENMERELKFKAFSQENPFEKTVDYKFLKS